MKFELLADNEEVIPILADWYFEEWGYLSKGSSLAKASEKLHDYLNFDKVPLIVIALENGAVVGASQLKYREMDIYPKKEHWLGGVYVSHNHRGQKIAEKIIGKVIAIAVELDICKLHLQTERLDGGMYKSLGWKPIEQVNYRGLDVLVMENEIKTPRAP